LSEVGINETKQVSVAELKELFATHLRTSDRLKRHEGLPTGIESFDRFLLWGGLPKGGLSLLFGSLGSGVTSLWIETAARVVAQGRWVAWVNGRVSLSPLSLHHKDMDLRRFVSVMAPSDEKKLLWLLQELMSSSLFELIGCDLSLLRLREHQLRKLQKHARQTHTALVFNSIDQVYRGSSASVFSLIVGFEKRRLLIERALHRPTPHAFPRSVNYARFTFHTRDRIGLGTNTINNPDHQERKSHSLPSPAGTANDAGTKNSA
jgi:recombination protein RecA